MIRNISILVFFLHFSCLTAQEFTDTITLKPSFLSKYYTYKNIYLKSDGMHILMNDIPEAKNELIKSERNAKLAGIFWTVFIGTTIWALAPKTPAETQEALAYVAGLSLVATLPFSFIRDKHTKKAVLEYNKTISEYNKYKQRKGE